MQGELSEVQIFNGGIVKITVFKSAIVRHYAQQGA